MAAAVSSLKESPHFSIVSKVTSILVDAFDELKML
jgi:hypothetical protein